MTLDQILYELEPITESGCLVWCKCNSQGYGYVQFNGKVRRVHRVVYEALVGPIPDGMQLDHLCRVRCCANVYHLQAVTLKENLLRGEGAAAKNARKTVCKHGHALTPDNIYWHRGRHCKTCKRANYQRWVDRCLERGIKYIRPEYRDRKDKR